MLVSVRILAVLVCLVVMYTARPAAAGAQPGQAARNPVLVIVLDGLRPDYVRADLMPNVCRLAEEGVFCKRHHSIYPTATRVNAASIATGSYPETHGIVGNTLYVPEADAEDVLSTGDASNLVRINEVSGGGLVTAATLGGVLSEAGLPMMTVSSGSTGSAFLANYGNTTGPLINTGLLLPETSREHVLETLGPVPEDALPSVGRNRWITDAYLELGLDEVKPVLTVMWYCDPDHTAHSKGIGSPVTNAAIREVDTQIGRILAEHEKRGITADILVLSDHGFSTYMGKKPIAEALPKPFLEKMAARRLVFSNGMVFVRDSDPEIRRTEAAGIARLLQAEPWVGAVFSPAASGDAVEGSIPGTLPFPVMRYAHDRAPGLMVDVRWMSDENEFGYPGGVDIKGNGAGHGSSSPYDIHATLIAHGPSFKKGVRNPAPTGNVDIAPTVCRLLGLGAPGTMTGRVLEELLVDGPDPAALAVETGEVSAETTVGGISYKAVALVSTVNGHRYLDCTRVERTP